ncbi:MAG: N-acylneuraminate-9-phosphate synthase [Candidatus Marinimicrobia bacterium]|nr:N-acylneuraminate-9-phosphate synthase [Candidatus Neomarinimicrobiota bacterium]
MSKIVLRDGKTVGDYYLPYIVAEINTSHFGDIGIAKKMIDAAKAIGCNCVKFQSWSSETLYSKTYYDDNPIAKRFVEKFSFSENELSELAQYCAEIKIAFASTPYSSKEVDFLINETNAPFIKVASMDLTNYPFLEYIGKKNIPIVLSTGMGDAKEIETAVDYIQNTGNNKIIILHCVSIYPPENSTLNLNNIIGLRKKFPEYPIGFSDHSIGTEMAISAVALGSALIEKHFTLNKNKIGMDNQMATEPDEMRQLIKQINNVQIAMGVEERCVLDAELEQRDKMRRSVVSTRDIKAGEILSKNDLDAKRPGTGISPKKIYDLIGLKVKNDITKDTLLNLEDLLD